MSRRSDRSSDPFSMRIFGWGGEGLEKLLVAKTPKTVKTTNESEKEKKGQEEKGRK